jgi:hypothetical protein
MLPQKKQLDRSPEIKICACFSSARQLHATPRIWHSEAKTNCKSE